MFEKIQKEYSIIDRKGYNNLALTLICGIINQKRAF
jgi:hypothetical protein